MTLRVLSLFSGIGAFEAALDELGIDWELDHYCEIDKYACQSYNFIHDTTDEDNLKDVRSIDYSKIGNIDLITYGFPCQDISIAGQQKGLTDDKGNLTRSGLFFSAADVIQHTRPKFAIFENVKNLVGKKFEKEFNIILSTLDGLGYNSYWKVLNAKNYGVPQNRERVYCISIRKDVDKGFTFPKERPLMFTLKDMLEDESNVDKKYRLSDEHMKRFLESKSESKGDIHIVGDTSPKDESHYSHMVYDVDGLMGALLNRDYKQPKQIAVEQIGNYVFCKNRKNPSAGRIYNENGLSPCLTTTQGGHRQPSIIKKGKYVYLRKLTPREYFRLMGFSDKSFDKIHGVSDTQLYKQAGNSIVVDVLVYIFNELRKLYPEYFQWDDEL